MSSTTVKLITHDDLFLLPCLAAKDPPNALCIPWWGAKEWNPAGIISSDLFSLKIHYPNDNYREEEERMPKELSDPIIHLGEGERMTRWATAPEN